MTKRTKWILAGAAGLALVWNLSLFALGGDDKPAVSKGTVSVVAPTPTPTPEPETEEPTTVPVPTPTPTKLPVSNTVMTHVTHVVDGDTIDTPLGRVRFIGDDTPEVGQCGYKEATNALRALIGGHDVGLTAVPGRDNKDNHNRLLRYVSLDGKDVGLAMIAAGYAKARYDSLDGYQHHPKQEQYRDMDAQVPQFTCVTVKPTPKPSPKPSPRPTATRTTEEPQSAYYANCAAAWAAGAAPLHRGDPGYRKGLDRDGDGTACEHRP